MANLLGARVITTVGVADKVEKARMLGADAVLNHSEENIAERTAALTQGRGVNVVIDNIGQKVWEDCLRSLGRGGRLVTCGATSGGTASFDLRYLYSRQLTILGAYMGVRDEFVETVRLAETNKLRPIIDSIYSLEDARAAQERMLDRKNFGKIVLTVETNEV